MYKEYMEFAKEIAKNAGKIMIKYFNQSNISRYKNDKTIVTLADTEINSYLIRKVKEKYPNHSVDGEEEHFGKSNCVWVCDPIDGTNMYASNIPVACFSLALVIDGISILGVVYDPFTDSLYSAVKGEGAFVNGNKISVNNIKLDDMRSISNFDNWPEAEYNIYPVVTELSKKTYFLSIRSVIRACMCVASGKFNLAIYPGTKHKNCDIASVKVIVEETGGKVTDLFGKEQRYDKDINGAVISNGIVHDETIEIINKLLVNIKERESKE
jgi:fructose-1,6-bisphosphatase/inositol monophosphatase family enzyme